MTGLCWWFVAEGKLTVFNINEEGCKTNTLVLELKIVHSKFARDTG